MLQLAMYTFLLAHVVAQQIPQQLWGKWAVKRLIPTTTISCWGNEDAKKVVGTEIEYSAGTFRWKDVVTKNAAAEVKTITADEFLPRKLRQRIAGQLSTTRNPGKGGSRDLDSTSSGRDHPRNGRNTRGFCID